MQRGPVNVRQLLRTSAFHLALIYASIFLVSVLVLFGILYWSTIGSVSRQIDATIATEIGGLAEQYERRGLNGLVDVLNERVARSGEYKAIYLLADSRLQPIAGNLRKWPSGPVAEEGQIEFDTVVRDGETTRYRANILYVGLNYRLLVGRDVRELTAISIVFRRAAVWGIAVVLLLAIFGSILVGLSSQRRIALINRTARRIMSGDLSERVPILGASDEYDDLATNINEMLSQIEILLENVRHVGDGIAHDLRTPLTRLRTRLEALAAKGSADADDLSDCLAEADSLLATFTAILRIARLESGSYRAAFERSDVAALALDVGELYEAVAEERNITLDREVSEPAGADVDRELIAQALTNLIDNALKYCGAPGQVRLRVEADARTVRIIVSDNGSGIPAADRDRVTNRFVRLETARDRPGNGLGLSLVKAVANHHGGRLIFGDNAPGLVATLELPREGSI
jgi:signal transduction histidine kinase